MKEPEITYVLRVKERGRVPLDEFGPEPLVYVKSLWKGTVSSGGAHEAFEFRSRPAAFRAKRRIKKWFADVKVFRRTR